MWKTIEAEPISAKSMARFIDELKKEMRKPLLLPLEYFGIDSAILGNDETVISEAK